MWYVYIIQGTDDKLYTGITTDISRRLAEHDSGHGGRFTRCRGPFKLRYKQEVATRSTALKREAAIKKLSRNAKLDLILSGNRI